MNLEPGRTLLHYRLQEKIGEGGMGVVFKALDTSLGREVAIKVLPADFAADADRLARFDREARLLATLNHPNIAGIYGIHQVEGIHFLAMELVAGEELGDRMDRGPLPVAEALRIAREIAVGLEAAHENGVIHRDLKPANVRLTPDGHAKVLDFGLAKSAAEPSTAGDPSFSPTMTSAGTVAGMILGTASYMSPEQASGQPADRRCDIWSFGVVLNELLTGKRLFDGETISHTLADVLRADIDLKDLPADVPRSVRQLLKRCLERNPLLRLRDIGEARIALQDAIDHPDAVAEETDASSIPLAPARRSKAPWIVTALVAAVAVAGLAWVGQTDRRPPQPVMRFTISLPNSANTHQGDANAIGISPDGTTIVTRGGFGNDGLLFTRALDEFEARSVDGTFGATAPQFSPDGKWISFIGPSDGLMKVRVSGGAPTSVGWFPAAAGNDGYHWASDGWVYYSTRGQIWRLPAAGGGEAEQFTQFENSDLGVPVQVHVLPEAGILLYSTSSSNPHLFAMNMKSKKVTDLQMDGSNPEYLEPGYLIFQQSGRLVVAGFDTAKPGFTTTSVTALPRAWINANGTQFSVSKNGTVAYVPRQSDASVSLVYVDRSGNTTPAVPAGLAVKGISDPRFSADGNRVAITTDVGEIWVIDLLTQTTTLVATDGFYPLWSPDGSEIAFTRDNNETYDIYKRAVDLSSPVELVLDAENSMRTMAWPAPDVLLLREETPNKGMDLHNLVDQANGTLETVLDGADDELAPAISADGRWMAYVSNYSGTDEIYITAFPTPAARTKISNNGGTSPAWSPDGQTLYYIEGQQLIEVTLETEPVIQVLSRETLFEGGFVQYRWSRQYDIHPDGKRFIMIESPPRTDVEVITNWFQVLQQAMADL